MSPYFSPDHPERLEALAAEAARWVGTPFFPNSSTPGPAGGVSCQKLASALYRASGFGNFDVPEVPMAHARFCAHSLMEQWLAGRPEFQRLEVLDPQPGDLLGFRLFRTVHHMGVMLRPGVFLHAIEHLGTVECPLADPTWGRRILAAWRPTIA